MQDLLIVALVVGFFYLNWRISKAVDAISSVAKLTDSSLERLYDQISDETSLKIENDCVKKYPDDSSSSDWDDI